MQTTCIASGQQYCIEGTPTTVVTMLHLCWRRMTCGCSTMMETHPNVFRLTLHTYRLMRGISCMNEFKKLFHHDHLLRPRWDLSTTRFASPFPFIFVHCFLTLLSFFDPPPILSVF